MKLFTLLTVCLFAFTATKLSANIAAKPTNIAAKPANVAEKPAKQESAKITWLTDIEKAKSL